MRRDLIRLVLAWGLALAGFVLLERFGPLRVGAFALAAVASFVLFRRAATRPIALALPPSTLSVVLLEYALRPADAAIVFTLALMVATELAWLVVLAPAFAGRGLARTSARLLLAATVFTLLFFGGELAAHRVWPRTPHGIRARAGSPVPSPYVPDPELQHVQAPGFVGEFTHPEYWNERLSINADGFRGEDWPASWPDRELRVLVLGDSTTVGFGVEADESIPACLEGELRERAPGRPVRVLNAGVAGYSPCHDAVLFERIAERVRPTHVVLVYYDGNDLDDCRTLVRSWAVQGLDVARWSVAAPAEIEVPVHARPPGSLLGREWWYRYSALYRKIETSFLPFVASLGVVAPDHAYGDALRYTLVVPDGSVTEGRMLVTDGVRALAAAARSAGAELLVVRMPARVLADARAFASLLDEFGAEPTAHDRNAPWRWLADDCRAQDVATVDLLPALEHAGPGTNPSYFLEGHPNRRGNRAAADRIAAAFHALGWCD